MNKSSIQSLEPYVFLCATVQVAEARNVDTEDALKFLKAVNLRVQIQRVTYLVACENCISRIVVVIHDVRHAIQQKRVTRRGFKQTLTYHILTTAMFRVRQLQIAFQTTCLQKLGHTYSTQTHIHPIRVRAFASTPRAAVTEHPTFKDSPLFQQLATNPNALVSKHSSPPMVLLINITARSERVSTVNEGARFAYAALPK